MADPTDEIQNERIRDNKVALDALKEKVGHMETEVAVIKTEVGGLRQTMDTGFSDLKEVIIQRAEKDEADRKRAHELALQSGADKKALWMKVLGLVGAALTIAGGSGGAYYALSPDKAPTEVTAPAPEAPAEATP
tara:strand:- start:161 stop:565 length:405 start_codon:yes stop_codon:yes gene_type:complete